MTEQDLANLEPLEPLTAAAPEAAAQQDPMATQRAGLGAPAFNVFCSDKLKYRFLIGGVAMFVGCMLPAGISAPGQSCGQTPLGAFYLLLAICIIWSQWAAISNNRALGVKWLVLAGLPFLDLAIYAFNFEVPNAEYGVTQAFRDMVGALLKEDSAAQRATAFWTAFGPGNILLFYGSGWAFFGLVVGLFGGMKVNKQAKQARRSQAAKRKRSK